MLHLGAERQENVLERKKLLNRRPKATPNNLNIKLKNQKEKELSAIGKMVLLAQAHAGSTAGESTALTQRRLLDR